VDTWQTFGEQLLGIRTAAGVSLRDLAADAGGELSKTAISRIERGERVPSSQTLLDLARALNLRIVIDADGVTLRQLRRKRVATSS
jgi:transcriptional regulator with XRE-family HTH domain